MNTRFAGSLVAFVLLWAISGFGQDIVDMNFEELRTNCTAEIRTGYDTLLKDIKTRDFKILAWDRLFNDRHRFLDNALCWAEVSTDKGTRWVLVHMARIPIHGDAIDWHSYGVDDVKNRWFLFFDHRPTNEDVYTKMCWFRFDGGSDWSIYSSDILVENWKAAIGANPQKKFNQQNVSPPKIVVTPDQRAKDRKLKELLDNVFARAAEANVVPATNSRPTSSQ